MRWPSTCIVGVPHGTSFRVVGGHVKGGISQPYAFAFYPTYNRGKGYWTSYLWNFLSVRSFCPTVFAVDREQFAHID